MLIARPPRSSALAPFVALVWYFEGEFAHARERILPNGRMQLLVNLHEDELRSYHGNGYGEVVRTRGAQLCGPYARHFAIDTAEQRAIAGVGFRPGRAYPFFAPPAQELFEQDVALDALWGTDGAALRERLLETPTASAKLDALEAVLLERVQRPLLPDPAVQFAAAALGRGATVSDVTVRLGLTPKRFTRRFREQVGLTPKRYARLDRFRRLLAAIERGRPVDWAALAVAVGYYDQAHLIRDFRAFSGMNPGAWRPRSNAERHHVPLAE